MVAMNPQTYKEDLAEVAPRRLAALRFELCRGSGRVATSRSSACRSPRCAARKWTDHAPAPALQEHGLYRRAVGLARHRHGGAARASIADQLKGKEKLISANLGGGRRSAATTRSRISLARCRSVCVRPSAPRARSWSPATMRPGSARSTPAPPCAPGIRSRRRPRSPRPSSGMPSACA